MFPDHEMFDKVFSGIANSMDHDYTVYFGIFRNFYPSTEKYFVCIVKQNVISCVSELGLARANLSSLLVTDTVLCIFILMVTKTAIANL